jgi:cytochrome P450 family 110
METHVPSQTFLRGREALGPRDPVINCGTDQCPQGNPDPDRFAPERFLGRDYGPFEYLPFGGGSRRCLGASFALYEMKIVLATVLRAHALELTDRGDVRSALRNTTASPAKKIRMVRAR